MRPKSATTSAARRSVDAASATSTSYARARPPADSIVATVSRRGGAVDVGDGDGRALLREQDSRGSADAGTRAGDETDLVGKAHHSSSCAGAANDSGSAVAEVAPGHGRRGWGIIGRRDVPDMPRSTPEKHMTMTIRRPPDVADSTPDTAPGSTT